MLKEKPAKGLRGYLIFDAFDGTPALRVYTSRDKFVDYKIHHEDLEIQIVDDGDASLYEGEYHGYDGLIDYPSQALGKMPE